MAEFFNVMPPAEAKQLLLEQATHRTKAERVLSQDALGRIVRSSIIAPHDLPVFQRSTMDGYAVHASDTFGASASLPSNLMVVGEILMGLAAEVALGVGEAALIHTGGMVPADADAVVQIENTQLIDQVHTGKPPYEIEVFGAVAAGQNTIQVGEDVHAGSEVLPSGHVIRAQDIGGLLALGITEIEVSRRPNIAIVATGDEIIAPSDKLDAGKIRDINSYTISALVEKHGAFPSRRGIFKDDYGALFEGASSALEECDMLVITAGSSVSARDLTFQVIDDLGEPGVLLHGVATRPGKPSIIGVIDGKPVLGLPGNPVSAMVQFLILGVPALYRLQGAEGEPIRGRVKAILRSNVPSASGREDYVPVRLTETDQGVEAEPVFGKSNLIYTLVNADGLLKVPMNLAGYQSGESGEVLLF